MSEPENVVEIRDLDYARGPREIFKGLNISIPRGKITAIMGPSGTGKTTLLRLITRQLVPDRGHVEVDGIDIAKLNQGDLFRLRKRIGMLFQNGALFDSDDVYENIRMGLTDPDQYSDEKFARERVRDCLALVNLDPATVDKMPSELSGGMRKRVGIARAIAGQPTYVLYDEPTSGLDPVNSDIIDGLIRRLNDELGVTGIMVTHDVRGAFKTADRLALLTGGKVIAEGVPEEFRQSTNPEVRAFLERDFDLAPI